MHVAFASDHAGFELKNELLAFVRDELDCTVADMGAETLELEDDYPDFVIPAARAVSESPTDTRAIILGGSGQGEAMCANRFRGVRAAVYYGGPMDIITLSREHNDANVLSLGARFLDVETAKSAVTIWLETVASDDPKYSRRIQKVEEV